MLSETFTKLQEVAIQAKDFVDFVQQIDKTGMAAHIIDGLKAEGFNSLREFYEFFTGEDVSWENHLNEQGRLN